MKVSQLTPLSSKGLEATNKRIYDETKENTERAIP